LEISEIIDILFCPDDHSSISLFNNELVCENCKRKFEMKENILDMTPKVKTDISDLEEKIPYFNYYESLFQNGTPGDEGTFGLSEKSISEGFVNETLHHLEKNITLNDVVCDVGAATGDYSLHLAKKCKLIIHCDLDLNGLLISKRKANQENVNNILFLRCDYFRMPFKNNKIDLAYSIDVIERGILHDKKLIKEISRIIKSKGTLIFDYHTKERSKLTRINPTYLSTYSNSDVKSLLDKIIFSKLTLVGTGFVPQLKKWSNLEYSILNPLSKLLKFPPGRKLVICLIQ
tara:strand:+ start:304 stop:1170 length:867 start_codon:yes stop_codon:yes gene_type:complete